MMNMATVDEKNYEWFKTNLSSLLEKHRGQYLIILGESLCGAFDTFEEALTEALKLAQPGDFLIQPCVTEEENTQVICSLMRLPNFS
jgi:hypothetical protein